MALLVPDAGEVALLDIILGTTTPEAQTLKLYSNNYDTVETTTSGNYTECTGSGYAAKALARATWGAASTNAGVTSKAYPAQVFSFTGAITVVGYYVVGATSGTIYWGERIYAGAGQAFGNGDSLTVTPKIQLD